MDARVVANLPVTNVTGTSKYLTKTRYVNGLVCSKWLWLEFNAPDKLPKPSESDQYRFDQGRQIGEYARQLFPGGILLEVGGSVETDRRSRALLEGRTPIFEAGFIHPGGACYARADVLIPVGKDRWDVVEVKSGGSVKEEYLHDVAFQRYCYTGAGLNIRKCFLLLINTKYERSAVVDPAQLFQEEDVTNAVNLIEPTVQPSVEALLGVARSRLCPEFGRGERFHEDEYGVHSDDNIWKEHPAADITDLCGGGKKILQLLESGVFRIRDIPQSVALTGRQRVQHAAHMAGRTHVDRKRISSYIGGLTYPLHFLDFETIYPAIPLFDGTRPFQQIPFQFSVHVVKAPGQKPRHHSFLSLGPKDPRQKLLKSLRRTIGLEGQLVAYNQSFEKSRLEELARFLPEHADWAREANTRFVDLMTPFRTLAYYNPAQRGSASLKAVLPALTGRSYDGLAIANGSQASLAFLYAAFGTGDGKRASPREVQEIRRALERYCGQDTEGMVWIVEKLTELANERPS
jgi:hypothetical protein